MIDHFSSDPHLLDLLSPREEAAIEKLNEDMKILNSVTVALQRENMDLSNVRMLFHETLKKFLELDRNNEYIVNNASIVESKHFENGIMKVLEGRENEMKMTEKVQCGRKWRMMTRILSLKRMRMISLQLYYKNGGRGAEIQFT